MDKKSTSAWHIIVDLFSQPNPFTILYSIKQKKKWLSKVYSFEIDEKPQSPGTLLRQLHRFKLFFIILAHIFFPVGFIYFMKNIKTHSNYSFKLVSIYNTTYIIMVVTVARVNIGECISPNILYHSI